MVQKLYLALIISLFNVTIAFNGKDLPNNISETKMSKSTSISPRLLQLTCPSNCAFCLYGTCHQCDTNRVIPNCDCKYGYYSDGSGVCQPCSTGCKVCSDASTCSECDLQYTLSNDACSCSTTLTGETCNDPQNLYYTSEVGFDLQSVVIIFNNIISIVGVTYDQTFTQSIENCKILQSQTQLDYGISSSVVTSGMCYINKSYQNRFVVVLGKIPSSFLNTVSSSQLFCLTNILGNTLIAQNLATPPLIQVSNIQIFNGLNYINPQSGNVITQDSQIGIQLNTITQFCSFSFSAILIEIGGERSISFNTPYSFKNVFTEVSQNNSCDLISPTLSTSVITSCNDSTGLSFDTSQFSDGQTATFQAYCSGYFSLASIDQVVVTFTTNSVVLNPLLTIENRISPYTSIQIFDNTQNTDGYQYTYSFNFYPMTNYDTVSTVDPDTIEQGLAFGQGAITQDAHFLIFIQGAQENHPSTIISQIIVLQTFLSQFTIQAQSTASATNTDPTKEIQITSTITDFDSTTFDINLFTIQWQCVTIYYAPCRDRSGVLFSLYNDLDQSIYARRLPYNYQFILVLTVTRNSNIYSTQVKKLNVQTATAVLSLLSTQQTNLYFSDQVFIELSYTNSLYSQKVLQNYTVSLTDNFGVEKQIQSTSTKISFYLYDYFPDLDLTIDNSVSVAFSVYDNVLDDTYSDSSLTYYIQLYYPPSGCQINLSTYSSFTSNTISLDSCVSNGQTYSYQFFYYTSSKQLQTEILSSGNSVTRKTLSVTQTATSVDSSLPAGDLIIMVLISQNSHVVSNFTLPVTITDKQDFTITTYESYLTSEYSKALQDQSNNSPQLEIFEYEIIIDAIEYYESNNPSYKPSSNINTMNTSIVQRLSDIFWSTQESDIYLLSAQINLRFKNTKISLSSSTSQGLKTQNESNIAFTIKQIQSLTSFTTAQRSYYQTYLSTTYQDLIINMNNLDQWNITNNLDAVATSTDVINGIQQTMLINQSPVTVSSDGVTLKVEKIDYVTFMQNYYPDQKITLDSSNASLTYYVSTQTWSSSHPIFRDELSTINSEYLNQTTNATILALLQKNYSVIVPQILTDTSTSRRMLVQQQANLQSPFKIAFGVVSEAITCIQRNSASGKWVTNSCTVFEETINGQRHVGCSCSTPTITSIIADVSDIFNNQNIKDLFSSTGFWRVFTLANWYEYAPIWTILGLNIGFVILIIVGYKFDKIDKQRDLKKAFLYHKEMNVEENEQDENIFMKIKNQKTKINGKDHPAKKKQSDQFHLSSDQPSLNQKVDYDFGATGQAQQQQQQQQQLQFTDQKGITQQFTISLSDEYQVNNKKEDQQSIPQTPLDQLLDNNNLLQDQFDLEAAAVAQPKQIDLENHQSFDQQIFEEGVLPVRLDQRYPSRTSKCKLVFSEQQTRDSVQNYSDQKNEELQSIDEEKKEYVKREQYNQNKSQEDNQQLSEKVNSVLSIKYHNQQNNNIDSKPNKSIIQTSQDQKKCQETHQLKDNQFFNIDQPVQQVTTIMISEAGEHQVHQGDIEEQMFNDSEPQRVSVSNPQQNVDIKQYNQIQKQQTCEKEDTQSPVSKHQLEGEKNLKRQNPQDEQALQFQKSKMKLKEYLSVQSIVKAMFSFHIFMSTFIIYNTKFSRILRFLIYYNKLVWNLAINSVFGVNLSIVQTIILSIITTVTLQIITTLLTILCKFKRLLPLVLFLTSVFDLFCYYSVLVVISGQSTYDSNIWIAKYFLNILLQEFIIGIAISFGMYYLCKRYFDKLLIPILFDLLGAGLLLQAFQS